MAVIKNKFFSFSRLERLPVKKIYSKNNLKDKDINNGFKIIKSKNKSKKNLIITQGYQIHRLLELFEKKKLNKQINFI